MVTAPAKEDHGKDAGKKPAEKKGELVPIERMLDALYEGVITTLEDVPKHNDVYGEKKPKIEEALKHLMKTKEILEKLPRKKPAEPTTKVKPNPQEIEKIREVINKFIPYVQQMQRNGEMFRADFTNLKTMEEGARKIEAALVLANGMMRAFQEIKGVNASVQGILKNEQYGFVPDAEQNVFEEALVMFLFEFNSFTYNINYALRYTITKEEDKKAVDTARKAVLDELKAVADVSEKNNEKFRKKKKEILSQVEQAKALEKVIKEEEKAELEKLKLLQKKAEPIIAAIKDEMKKLLDSIGKQDNAFDAFNKLETITVKELKELKEIPEKINAEVGKIKAASEEKARLQATIPQSGTEAFKKKAEQIRKLDAVVEASKKEIKAQLDAFKTGISMEKTLGRDEVIRLNIIVNSTQEIISIANQMEDTLKEKLLAFLQSDQGKKAFPGDRINKVTIDALGDINKLQTIIGEEQEERNMIGTVGRVMKDRAQKEEVAQKKMEEIKKDDAIFKDDKNLINTMPRIVNALKDEIDRIAGAEQALVNALVTTKETANKIKTQVAAVQNTVGEVEALLPAKGLWGKLLKMFKR
ncbi:hypothetical protein HZC31_05985 [Candidatus Woesearchaeota archaeon]|nr:hypothetical protein [Candidatus Woesearchaeota archaeon]